MEFKKNIGRILKKYELSFKSNISDMLKCIMCKRVLNNSQFAPCGCRFCLDCIKEYLKHEEKNCPSGKVECQEITLDLAKNIFNDDAANVQISNLIVQCPQKNCNYECKLLKLSEHLHFCSRCPADCEFSVFNSDSDDVYPERMKEHYDEFSVRHSKLMFSYMMNMKQSVESVKLQLEKLTNDKDLYWKSFNSRIANFEEEMKDSVKDVKVYLSEKRTDKGKSICQNDVKESLQRVKDDNEKFKVLLENNQFEVSVKFREFEERFNTVFDRLDDVERLIHPESNDNDENNAENIGEIAVKKETVEPQLEIKLHRIDDQSVNRKKSFGNSPMVLRNLNNPVSLAKYIDGHYVDDGFLPPKRQRLVSSLRTLCRDFEWFICDIHNKFKKCKWECSTPFFSDGNKGYMMCLCFQLVPWSGLHLVFVLMRGKDDDRLQWPMQRTVQIDVVDLDSPHQRRVIFSDQFKLETAKDSQKLAYNRPDELINNITSQRDGFVGFKSFNELKQLGAIKNNSMFVRCRVLP